MFANAITDATLDALVNQMGPTYLRHCLLWLDRYIDESEQEETARSIVRGLREYPDAIDRALSWREIADRG